MRRFVGFAKKELQYSSGHTGFCDKLLLCGGWSGRVCFSLLVLFINANE